MLTITRPRGLVAVALVASTLVLGGCAGLATEAAGDRPFGLKGRFGDCPEAPRSQSFRKYQQFCDDLND